MKAEALFDALADTVAKIEAETPGEALFDLKFEPLVNKA